MLPPSRSYTKVKESGQPNIKPKIQVGNSHTLERRRKSMDEMERRERNKEAWYERNDLRAWNGISDWLGRAYEDPYSSGDPHSTMDEIALSSENEDKSDDESICGRDLDNIDPSLFRPQASVTTSVLKSRPDRGNRPTVSQVALSHTPNSPFGEQLSTSTSPLSNSTSADRRVAISAMSGPQSVNQNRSRPRKPASQSDTLGRNFNSDTSTFSDDQITPPPLNNAHSNSESNRQMTPLGSRSQQSLRLDPSNTLDERRTRLADASRSVSELVPTPQFCLARSNSPTISTQPDINIRVSIAADEAQIYATQRAAAMFYLDPVVGATSTGRNQRRPSEPRGRGQPRATEKQLMLFREPPPWNGLHVEASRMVSANDTKGQQRAQGNLVLGGQSIRKAAEGMRELMQMVKRRKLGAPGPTIKVSDYPEAVTNPMSRNPFRRKK